MINIMNTTQIAAADQIRELYKSPDNFIEAALACTTTGIEARTHDWFKKYPNGMFVTEIRFTEEYITENPKECFVRSMLADASMCEGRGRDIFRGIPQPEREKFLREKIMDEYIIPKELRLTVPDLAEFIKLFTSYAELNNIPNDKRERQFYRTLSAELPKASVLEIGGSSENDHLYYITKGAMVYIVNFGEWKATSEKNKDK